MTSIDKDSKLINQPLFIQEFKDVVETKNMFSRVATKVIANAKNITSPFLTVTPAKTYKGTCRVPVGTATIGQDELVLDRYIGNALTDCKEELSYAKFNLTGMMRSNLYATIIKKANEVAATDFIADATAIAAAQDLSTPDKVREFLITVNAANTQTVGLNQTVDGARVKKCDLHGKAFVACGQEAFVKITSQIASITAQSTTMKGIDGNFVETPYGVAVINLGAAVANAKQLIYGTAGVPTMGYREDKVDVDMGEITGLGTAAADDLDITTGDATIDKTWYMSAKTLGRNGIYSNVTSLVSAGLMA